MQIYLITENMELVFRVGLTGLVLNNKSKCTKNCIGLDEERSKERPYLVVEKYYDYEERHYPSCTVVATKLKTRNRKSSGIVERYLRLRNYFRGENEADFQMERMTPALTKVEVNKNMGKDHTYTLTLAVGQEDTVLPKPRDSDLYLTTLPAMNVFVRKYDGFPGDRNISREAQDFRNSLSSKHDCHKDFFYSAGYDSPFKFFNTRNEIWFVKK